MSSVYISKVEQDAVFRILSGILHLGNIRFHDAYDGEGSEILNTEGN